MSLLDSPIWQSFRDSMPITRKWAYFDHAAVAPLSGPGLAAMNRWADEAAHEGTVLWPQWSAALQRIRAAAAAWVGAQPEEIALIRSTTEGISLVAEGYPWQQGDNVVTLADEFPSNVYPWLNLGSRGIETRRVPTVDGRVDLNRLADACDDRTRIVSISWVSYCTGWRNDLPAIAELAHRRGALFFLDAIQGLGAFSLDVRAAGVDFFSADSHKWMLGPEGAGLFYIAREHLDRLRATGVGWSSVVNSMDYTQIKLALKPTAARFEGGAMNMSGFLAMGAGLELLQSFGAEAIGQRVIEVTDYACQRLVEIGAEIRGPRDVESDSGVDHRSGIVMFDMPGRDPQELRKQCIARQVILSVRSGRLRISPHAYANKDDIDRLVEALAG